MTADSLEHRWVRDWASDLDDQLRAVLSAFDDYYPFPPGENAVVWAEPGAASAGGAGAAV
ncbi:hypothetical protein JIG36_41515 [Actinoplanes sp. LDG1-06]|uniref:GNAT family N-acetyltransferase n=1 Tax=Paractinoplanes ovalisporus TaxID=2810368 RepID=A0ABS2AQ85_9ACTN|nr:hypothetical protein [Actinoplanes ovalisporus]MBM2622001.1 hypothetical protein [Actinoplanes ovalisporus]